MDENTTSIPNDDLPLPPPLVGCLVCHAENTLTLAEGRKIWGIGEQYPVLTCANCGATAFFNWDETQNERWRIRYRKISSQYPYENAALRFKVGWLDADEALDISTNVYVQRQRMQQVANDDFSWLKPSKLSPPPPLMSADEIVYLSIKAASYCETAGNPLAFLPVTLPFGKADAVLDTGLLYVTDAKIHLLGQRRDRSHRLSEIQKVDYHRDTWRIHIDTGEQPHHYQGYSQSEVVNAELISEIVNRLRQLSV